MLARRLPSILPAMSLHEALEVTKIYSVAGLLVGRAGVVRSRPFRFPHHTITQTALVGGGALARSRLIRTRPRRPPAEVVPVAGLAPARPQGTSM
jgi:predicted ATPase with chaperone activity